MDKVYSMSLQETEELLAQRKKQRLEEFARFKILFDRGSDGQKPGDDLTSPEVPVNPKSPIIMGGRKKLEE